MKMVRLADVAAKDRYSIVGGPFGSKLGTRDYRDEGVPVIRGANLPKDRRIDLADLVFVSDDKVERDLFGNLAFPGDVIVTQRGTLGQVGIVPDDCSYARFVVSQSQMKLTVDGDVADPRFVYYVLKSEPMQRQLIDLATSSGVPHINLEIFRNLQVPLIELQRQRQVAEVLTAFDDLIENNRRRIEILEEMARLLYREWFVHFRFPGHENVEMVDSELGPIPSGWVVRSLGNVADNFDRQRVPLSKMQRAERQGPFPYYGAAKIFDYVDDYLFDGEYLLLGEDGTVVDSEGGPMLQLVSGKFWCNNHAHVLRGTGVSTRRLWCSLRGYPVAGHVTGAAQPKITQANMNRIPVVVPNTEVANKFDATVDPLIDLWFNLAKQNETLREARDLLLPRLVSGELDVSELDLDTVLT